MRKAVLSSLAAVGCLLGIAAASAPALAAEGTALPEGEWSHKGIFGTFDRAAAQRGFKVFEQVCSSCHSAKYLHFRNLTDLGFSQEEVKAIAAKHQVEDGPDDNGEMFMRDAEAKDSFPAPFPNEAAARVANGGALPPDLSLMVKARLGEENYVRALMLGYEDAPVDFKLPVGKYYNAYFPGHSIGMPPPLAEGLVEYDDGTEATPEQMADDVTTFLAWVAEPKMEERKQTGIKAILFLLVLTGVFILAKRRIWAKLH